MSLDTASPREPDAFTQQPSPMHPCTVTAALFPQASCTLQAYHRRIDATLPQALSCVRQELGGEISWDLPASTVPTDVHRACSG